MKTIIQITTATMIAVSLFSLAPPAFATNTREAIKACDSNPKCKFDVGADGVVISVGGTLIVCPIKNGPCGVSRHTSIGQGSNAQIQETGDDGAVQ